jgi:hypothetical protein
MLTTITEEIDTTFLQTSKDKCGVRTKIIAVLIIFGWLSIL